MDWLKLLKRKFQTVSQLDSEARSLLVQALVLLPLVSISLDFWGTKATQRTLERLSPLPDDPSGSDSPKDDRNPFIEKAVRMVLMASRYTRPWATCLRKSLVLWFFLRRQGIDTQVRIGVRNAGEFQAHAWVEYQGKVLGDRQDVRDQYAIFEHPLKLTGL